LSFKELAAKKALTGGPITAAASVNAGGMAPGFSTQFCDVEVDPETGKVTILRFVAAHHDGCAIDPSYVEGQIQGGVAQGIGWVLNEEYIYDWNGRLDNASFLDYRVPVASDMPMIEPILVEVPNPAHPYGAKGSARSTSCRRWRRSPMRSTAPSTAASRSCRCRHRRCVPPSTTPVPTISGKGSSLRGAKRRSNLAGPTRAQSRLPRRPAGSSQ
jgi:hypothetical protein